TPLLWAFRGCFSALVRDSHSSSRSATIRSAFFAHEILAISLGCPLGQVECHMLGYLLSGNTRPNRRFPETRIQPSLSRFQARPFIYPMPPNCLQLYRGQPT